MSVGAGLYMYDVVVKKFTRSLSHLLTSFLLGLAVSVTNTGHAKRYSSAPEGG